MEALLPEVLLLSPAPPTSSATSCLSGSRQAGLVALPSKCQPSITRGTCPDLSRLPGLPENCPATWIVEGHLSRVPGPAPRPTSSLELPCPTPSPRVTASESLSAQQPLVLWFVFAKNQLSPGDLGLWGRTHEMPLVCFFFFALF